MKFYTEGARWRRMGFVDLTYPKYLHKRHNSFPLAPETIEITYDMLSPYSRRCIALERS